MTFIEYLIIAVIVGILAVVGCSVYENYHSEKIVLIKNDWNCSKKDTRTVMQPISNGKSTTLMPMVSTVCVEYSHR